MINVLIVTTATAKRKDYDELLSYSRLFSLCFSIACSKAEVLKHFISDKPLLFLAECADEEQEEVKFLRKLSPGTPLIGLGSRASGEDEDVAIKAFQNGAVDFIRLPCSSREFYYRLSALIRLLHLARLQENASVMKIGELKIFLNNQQVMLKNEFVPLTKSEYYILLLLAGRLNQTVTNKELYQKLWSNGELMATSRTIAVHISRLRRKLKLERGSPLRITAVYKNGYCLKTDAEKTDEEDGNEYEKF